MTRIRQVRRTRTPARIEGRVEGVRVNQGREVEVVTVEGETIETIEEGVIVTAVIVELDSVVLPDLLTMREEKLKDGAEL